MLLLNCSKEKTTCRPPRNTVHMLVWLDRSRRSPIEFSKVVIDEQKRCLWKHRDNGRVGRLVNQIRKEAELCNLEYSADGLHRAEESNRAVVNLDRYLCPFARHNGLKGLPKSSACMPLRSMRTDAWGRFEESSQIVNPLEVRSEVTQEVEQGGLERALFCRSLGDGTRLESNINRAFQACALELVRSRSYVDCGSGLLVWRTRSGADEPDTHLYRPSRALEALRSSS
jgi:hypothetical protein